MASSIYWLRPERFTGAVIAPLTIQRANAFDEIMSGLSARDVDVVHFALCVPLPTLERRISKGRFWPWPPTPARWRRQHAEECVTAFEHPRFETRIDADHAVSTVVESIQASLSSRGSDPAGPLQ